jgi:membrane-bound lytic murein transglycosylase D
VHRIRAGQTLRLPVDGKSAIEADSYRVSQGDTLSEIARRAGIPTAELAEANNLDPNATLQPGQTLKIAAAEPARDTAAPAGAIRRPEAVEPISERDITMPLAPAEPHWTGDDPVDALTRQISALTSPAAGEPQSTPTSDPGLGSLDTAVSAADPETTGDLAADPSDYSVADNRTIEIQAAETLGHYAEWLELRASDLRRVNNLRYGEPLVIGNRLELDFARVEPATFEKRRRNYHRELQSAFFERNHIRASRTYRIERGDSLWKLTRPSTDIPVWLLRQYNPDLDFSSLKPGDEIRMPVVEQQEAGPVVAEDEAEA